MFPSLSPGAPLPSQTDPSLSQTGPSLSQTGPSLSQTGPSLSQTGPSLSQSGPSVSQSGPAGAMWARHPPHDPQPRQGGISAAEPQRGRQGAPAQRLLSVG